MAPAFKDCTAEPEQFFSILPPDWQEAIRPFWPGYGGSARIYILESPGETLGGGIVFSTVSPDTMFYQEEAQRWFSRGYLYIGFLWVAEQYRGRKLGGGWLEALFLHYPGQRFWLAIEDIQLLHFYERYGFRLVKEVSGEDGVEWILAKG